MDRADAEAIALAGGEPARELVVTLLDALDRVAAAVDEVAGLRERVLELERQLKRTSRTPQQHGARAWEQAQADALIEPAGCDPVHGEQLWRLTPRGLARLREAGERS